jgi:hypothetical protein
MTTREERERKRNLVADAIKSGAGEFVSLSRRYRMADGVIEALKEDDDTDDDTDEKLM